jgi:hypothetical protein
MNEIDAEKFAKELYGLLSNLTLAEFEKLVQVLEQMRVERKH